jgi:hypothetical protein
MMGLPSVFQCCDTSVIEGAPPDGNLIRIANIVNRSHPADSIAGHDLDATAPAP